MLIRPQRIDRRSFLQATAAAAGATTLTVESARGRCTNAQEPLALASRRELFVDSWLIDRLEGAARRMLHHPVARELVLRHDEPWEGSGSGYHSVFRDGDRYRMYYKAWHLEATQGKVITNRHPLYCCYAESDDGIQWRKPELGIHEFNGSRGNNIVLASGRQGGLQVDAGHPAVFRDDNPAAPQSARYKAILRSAGPNGLLPFQSPDGIHWSPLTDHPILSGQGAFDSQNLAFWDPLLGRYRGYWRFFASGKRAIRTGQSDDLVQWDSIAELTYENSPVEQLYTNQVKPYERAPHILIGFPTRYVDRGKVDGLEDLPEADSRRLRASASARYGSALTECLLMASRDGRHFERWNEAFLRPGPERPGTWNYGQQYVAWHVVETPSSLEGAARELSLYASESYWTPPGSQLRRYTLRLDGFVSLHAPWDGGTLISRPLTFTGRELALNFATSAAGSVRVELQDAAGRPLSGFSLADCPEHFGDSVERVVRWRGSQNLARLQGQVVRLCLHLRDADVYALQFRA